MFKSNFYNNNDMRVRERLRQHKENEELYLEVNTYEFSESGCLFHNISELAEFTDVNDDLNKDSFDDIDLFTKDFAV